MLNGCISVVYLWNLTWSPIIVGMHNYYLSLLGFLCSDLSRNGISCRVLNVWSLHQQKLNMVGKFTQLHTLNLDFCASITNFHKDCFSGMPNLKRLSMCETRVSNLWAATAVLSNLPSLVELRFQKCLCCWDTGPCISVYGEKPNLFVSGNGELEPCTSLGHLGFSRQAESENEVNVRDAR